jgi:hypothetical protein
MTFSTRTFLWLVVLSLLALALSHVRAEDDGVDGFDEPSETILMKTATDISASNLNPFQVEVFVSYCVQ